MSVVQHILADARFHDYLAILKGARNGFVYGVKIRFPHALLMSILFGKGDWKSRARQIFSATRQHALNLASFVSLYKTLLLVQRRLNGGKERKADTFIAGLIGGYIVFGDRTPVNEQKFSAVTPSSFPSIMIAHLLLGQIVLYVCSRVVASFIPRAGKTAPSSSAAGGAAQIKPVPPDARLFSFFAAVSWGAVMWLFNHREETIQPGMLSSMRYLYRDSERWTSLRTLLWHNK